MSARKSVALLLETSNAYSRGLLDGIIAFVQQHRTWSVYLPEQERGATPPNWLRNWQGDGIIARIETEAIARAVRRTGLPVVDVSAARYVKGIPWVETDDGAIAELAAEHLLSRGFQNLAYCGDPDFNWSRWREQRFRELVHDAGARYFVHQSIPRLRPGYSWNRDRQQLARWLKKLPQPVGIMACYDIKAQQLLAICRDEGIAVPEQVAVIGVDNDRRLCELCDPPLSSVIPNTVKAGFQAAEMLGHLMANRRPAAMKSLITPLGVETRQSTDVLAIDDPDIVSALQYIRQNAFSGINVHDVLRHVPLSRRVLESRFQQLLGRTPHAEILRLRIDRVKQLLVETDLSLAEIAGSAGFRHTEYLSVAFKRSEGETARDFRKRQRAGGSG
ncbi:MAG: XylR family transcriptional regulator [Fuerstiella sp.]